METLNHDDIAEAIQLMTDSFMESVAPSWSDSGVQAFLDSDLKTDKLGGFISNGCLCLKAVEDGRMVGVLMFSSPSKLAHLFVKPTAYRAGVAKSLFKRAKERVVVDGSVDYIELTSTEFAVAAYERLGFRKSARAFRYSGCVFQPMVYWLGNDRLADKVEFIS